MDHAPNTQPRSLSAGQLAAALQDGTLFGDPALAVSGVQCDSRHIRPVFLFAVLRGADFDGHDCVGSAIANGVGALLVESRFDVDVPQIVTPNSRAALADAYRPDIENHIRAGNTALPRLKA